MSNGFDSPNPYTSPYTSQTPSPAPPPSNIKVILPAVALIVVGSLGLLMSIFSVLLAVVLDPPAVDPNAPEWLRQFQQGGRGPVAATIQSIFILINLAIISGGIMMARFKNWVFALVACILAAINFGNFCCLLGLPIGIWGIIILSMADVKQIFDSRR
jgi:hypothetical protein